MFLEKLLHSLTGKLILTIGTLMIGGSMVFWYFLIRHQERELINNSVKYGNSIVDSINKSTRYGMLTFQQHLIQQTIEAVGSAEGVINVRIFDNRGKIAYSSYKKDIGTVFDRSSPLCANCHAEGGKPEKTQVSSITRGKEYRILNIIQPIYNEPSCYTSACHVHTKEQKVLGLVEADLSLALLDKSIQQQAAAITIYVLVFIIVLSVVLGIIFWQFVTTPLQSLAQGMKRVAGGDLNHRVSIQTKDELEELAKAFNAMTSDLRRANNELVEWGNTLEKKVQQKAETIKKAQAQLIHSEKLASLGRMAAGVAYEINSPITGIITFSRMLQEKFPDNTEERKNIDAILEQANNCSAILQGLLGFAKASTDEKGITNVKEILESSLKIVRNKPDFHDIKLITEFDESLPGIKADPSQLQQVFLNMIVNASDAIEGRGTITVITKKVNEDGRDYVEIEFRDTGSGISDANLARLFEPFFTTKTMGKGTGLGLAVSHGIIQDHGGKIFVKTKLGVGSSFFVRLPFAMETE